jgi:hypothetical protein
LKAVTSFIPSKCTIYYVHLVGIKEVIDCKNARRESCKIKIEMSIILNNNAFYICALPHMYFLACAWWSFLKKQKYVAPSKIKILAEHSCDWRFFVDLFADTTIEIPYSRNGRHIWISGKALLVFLFRKVHVGFGAPPSLLFHGYTWIFMLGLG